MYLYQYTKSTGLYDDCHTEKLVPKFSSNESTYLPGRSYRVTPPPPQKKGPPQGGSAVARSSHHKKFTGLAKQRVADTGTD